MTGICSAIVGLGLLGLAHGRERDRGADRENNGNSCGGGGGLLFKETEENNSAFVSSGNTMRQNKGGCVLLNIMNFTLL